MNYVFQLIIFITINNFYVFNQQIWTTDDLIPRSYNPSKPPIVNGTPVIVAFDVSIHQILSVNEVEQTFTVEASVHLIWNDSRLNTPDNYDEFALDATWKSKLWTPDYIFMNSVQGVNGGLELLPLQFTFSNGSVIIMSIRKILKLSCTMDLFYFPQDTQECYVDISAAVTRNKMMRFIWKQFNVFNEKECSKFEFPWISRGTCVSIRGPDYECIRGQIHFFRRLSYYIIRIYAPSFLMVITAFIGFWIPVIGYPARVAIAVTPLLTLATQQNQINAEINVHYVVALHIWMMFCTFFVFMSLVEYALAIIYCHHVDEKKDCLNSNSTSIITRNTSPKTAHFIKKSLIKIYGAIDWSKAPGDRNKVDYCARVVFPLLYVIFVLIYVFVFIVPWAINKY